MPFIELEPLTTRPRGIGMRRPFKFSSGSVSNRQFKIAAMAEAFNLPVVSHLYPEISVHLVAGVPNGLTVEYMPWNGRPLRHVAATVVQKSSALP